MPLNIKKSVQQMVDEADSQIETMPLADVMKLHGQPGVTFIDIRDPRSCGVTARSRAPST